MNADPTEGTSDAVGRGQIASLMCESALQLLRFHFPECSVLHAVVKPTTLSVVIVVSRGEKHTLDLPLNGNDRARAMLAALARLEEHLRLIVGRRPTGILAGMGQVSDAKSVNVVQLVRPQRKDMVRAHDVEELCVLLSGKFGQLQNLFTELRAEGDIDPEVLHRISAKLETLATAALDVAQSNARATASTVGGIEGPQQIG